MTLYFLFPNEIHAEYVLLNVLCKTNTHVLQTKYSKKVGIFLDTIYPPKTVYTVRKILCIVKKEKGSYAEVAYSEKQCHCSSLT